MNDVALAGQVLTSPATAFAELRERPRFWSALLTIILIVVAQMVWYYSVVDIEWLKDHMFAGNARIEALPPESKARMMASMTQNTMMWPGTIAMAIMLPLIFSVIASYYALAGKITNVQQPFKHWFALSVWSSVPMLIGAIAGAVILLMQGSGAQMGPSELQILSANELFFQYTPAQPGYQLLTQISFISIWTWAISIVGVKTWSNRSWQFSATFVLLPIVFVYSIWAFVAFS